MTERKTLYELINALEVAFEDIISIVKAMSNEKRFTILINLLTGEKTFNDLKEETGLKKTALSNHLIQLIDVSLIAKPDHNKYIITNDGELFIRALEVAYKKSNKREKKQTEELQQRKFSESFVDYIFGKI